MPRVSAIVATRNRPQMLAQALDSVRRQTLSDLEIIVVSTGESADMRRASRAAAAGCLYLALDEGNASWARNHAAARATAEWIAFLDDDDIWLPTKLERQLAAAIGTDADMVTCDTVLFWPDGVERVSRARLPGNPSHIGSSDAGMPAADAAGGWRWCVRRSATLVRKSVFDKFGGFDADLNDVDDIDLWHRISLQHRIFHMDDVLCRHRQGHVDAWRRNDGKAGTAAAPRGPRSSLGRLVLRRIAETFPGRGRATRLSRKILQMF